MKKVVSTQTETISIDQITNDSIIGIDWGGGNRRSVVIQTNNRTYTTLSNRNLNLVNNWTDSSIEGYTRGAMQRGGEVYQFDTIKDCLKWMSL